MAWSEEAKVTKRDDHARFSVGRYSSKGNLRLRIVISRSLAAIANIETGLRYSIKYGRNENLGWVKLYRDAEKGNVIRLVTNYSSDFVLHFNLDVGVPEIMRGPPVLVREWAFDDMTKDLYIRLPEWAVPGDLWAGMEGAEEVVEQLRVHAARFDEMSPLLIRAANLLEEGYS